MLGAFAAPANAQRFDIDTPCKKIGECADCMSSGTICAQFVTTRFCKPEGRIKVVLIGEELGIDCTMEELERTRQGVFSINEAYTLSDIENNRFDFIPLSKVLEEYFSTIVDSELEFKIKNGALLPNIYGEDMVVFKNIKNEVIGIYEVYPKDKKKIKPIRVFK